MLKERQKMKKQSVDEGGEGEKGEKASVKSKGHRRKRSSLKYNAS